MTLHQYKTDSTNIQVANLYQLIIMFIRPSTVLVVLLGLTALVSAGAPVDARAKALEDEKRKTPPISPASP
ncbi:uncharacterized protein F5147DRAFT_838102 [Suillus discolor]|uniref:Uncharacterized protein n=1 Tax=Suillus discolor TaxID=1912936 RepID=A0A9P7F4F9_9AGAM|nr:uncharacterized protein F5147DRAFT_838102 [Suillus discolor]KAG2105504.1 hypothetical protein F5147DRAFT_838102 [Suillus discolor]